MYFPRTKAKINKYKKIPTKKPLLITESVKVSENKQYINNERIIQ